MSSHSHIIKNQLNYIKHKANLPLYIHSKANSLYRNGLVRLLHNSPVSYEFFVEEEYENLTVSIDIDKEFNISCNCNSGKFCHHQLAALKQLWEDINYVERIKVEEGKAYTREGMIFRVLKEREDKAKRAKYSIEWNNNIYDDHKLQSEKTTYIISFREKSTKNNYCSCPDFSTNKLGTCKHLIFAYNQIKRNPHLEVLFSRQKRQFSEVFADPENNYKIRIQLSESADNNFIKLTAKYFDNKNFLVKNSPEIFLSYTKEIPQNEKIKIRPEVYIRLKKIYNYQVLKRLENSHKPDFTKLSIKLFKYQKEGILFCLYKEGAIIADEMGLGKTAQAIATAFYKREMLGFKKCLIICPATLKSQWKSEIRKVCRENALIVEGDPKSRQEVYERIDVYFHIVSYEAVLRDKEMINSFPPDFIILDEAQRIKNYVTQTANAVKSLERKHSLVITGTPIENRLTDLYSIVAFVNPDFLSPLWEFSYKHCYFDTSKKDKITGYYNLDELNTSLKEIIIRREKKELNEQLPNIRSIDIPVKLTQEQEDFHRSYSNSIARILAKKIITPFDMQHIMMLLAKMRMVCDSTFLVDETSSISPKLDELKFVLKEKLNIQKSQKKVIIFSEWKKMLRIISKMLKQEHIGFVELTGDIPVAKRGDLIRKFESDEDIKILLSSETGSTGLNLQFADTVINFELPWNPAKKNQRTGRIDRIGQKQENLTVISFLSLNSIEQSISAGLLLKQNLFDGVLNSESETSTVDMSAKGRSQFLESLQNNISKYIVEEKLDSEKMDLISDSEKMEEIPDQQASIEENIDNIVSEEHVDDLTEVKKKTIEVSEPEKFADVMKKGMEFLSGLYKMSTGNDLALNENTINFNKETGEVTFKFKMK